jgi:rod shape-determining protein MreC
MQRLIDILLHFKEYLLLAILVIVSLVLLGQNNNRQIKAIRSYTVGAVGVVQNAISVIPNIFELRRENEVLRQLNVNLSDEVNRLREARLENMQLRQMLAMKERKAGTYMAADVVGKSIHLLRNTIAINMGEEEGVKADMPLVSEAGLVGKVIATSGRYAIGQLVLNKDFRVSAKIQRSRVDGIVAWEGGDYLYLKNVARNQDVREGDVVVTSEYSNLFPPDIKIGHVVQVIEKPGSLFKEVKVQPSVDFSSLEQVFVVETATDSERTALEQSMGRLRQ